MKRGFLVVVVIIVISFILALAGCKGKMPTIETDFKDIPADAVVAEGLSALDLFNQAIEDTYSGDYKRVNMLDFYTSILGGQKQDEVASYYKIEDTYMRTLVVQGEGNVAGGNTSIRAFYYNGENAKIAEKNNKNLNINFDNVDYSQVANEVTNCKDTEQRLLDYSNFTSYIRTREKLSDTHNDEVYTKDNLYYATIKFDMDVGVTNSEVQQAVNRAVESGTGADKNSITWLEDTVWNCIFEKVGDKFYLKKTYLYENYTGKQKKLLTATCSQTNISEFWYGEDIDMPQAIISLLEMD